MMSLEDNSDVILCFSGGLDSLIAYYVLRKPKTIYFDCVDYSSLEKECVLELIPDTIIDYSLDLRKLQKDNKNGYILHRNLLLASIASNYSPNVAIAGIKDDVVSDKSPIAFNMMSKLLTDTSNKDIRVFSPFWGYTKSDIVNWFMVHVTGAEDLMERSVSCYNNQMFCGKCPSCFRKACALWDNGIRWQFNDTEMMDMYLNKAINNEYIPERNKSITKFVLESRKWLSM